MKRLLSIILSLLMLASLFVLCSCNGNEDEDDDDEEEEGNIEVTKAEWIKAFELDGVDSFTIDCTATFEGEGDVGTLNFKYNDGDYYMLMDINGEERETEYGKLDEKISTLLDLSIDDAFDEFRWVVEEYLDYAYAKFTYDEKLGGYSFTIADEYYDEELTINVYFGSNKLIKRIFLSLEYSGGTDTSDITFSSYNKTNKPVIPRSEVSSLLENYPALPSSVAYLDIWNNGYKIEPDDKAGILDALDDLISDLNANNVVEFYKAEEGSDDVSFSAVFETAPTYFALEDAEIEYTELEIHFYGTKLRLYARNSAGDSLTVYIEDLSLTNN